MYLQYTHFIQPDVNGARISS